MALDIDTTTAIRTPARYRELARAVFVAPASTQETNAVEWKSEADPAQKRWQAHLSRQMLGFANRDPDVASKTFEGCGYVMAGVSPRQVPGTPVHDVATLEAWFAAYVGQAPRAPEWSPIYVDIEGVSVLILTIEPPRPGHPIWTLQKDFPILPDSDERVPYRAGSVFVRRKGATYLADPGEMEMLSRRLTATSLRKRIGGLSLIVPDASRAVALDLGDEAVTAWVAGEKAALRSMPKAPAGAAQTFIDAQRNVAEAIAGIADMMWERDPRSEEAFEAELATYVEKATKVVPSVCIRRAYEQERGRIELTIKNETEDPIHKLQVELYIGAGGVLAASEDVDVPQVDMPGRPIALGKARQSKFPIGLSRMDIGPLLRSSYNVSPEVRSIGRRVSIDNSGSTRLTFAPIDLYPEEAVRLEPFYLLVNSQYAGKTLTAEWSARSKDAQGVHRGQIQLGVDDAIPSVEDLLAKDPGPAHDEDE